MTKAQPMTDADFATQLGWDPKYLVARLNALDLLDTCTRCGGCGRFSFNQITGDRCFKCAGVGKTKPKLTVKLLARAQELVAAGALQPYLDRMDRVRAARAAMKSHLARAEAAYAPISAAYQRAYEANYPSKLPDGTRPDPVEIPKDLFRAQHLANTFWFGCDHGHPKTYDPFAHDGCSRILIAIKRSGDADPVRTADEIKWRADMLEGLRDLVVAAGYT